MQYFIMLFTLFVGKHVEMPIQLRVAAFKLGSRHMSVWPRATLAEISHSVGSFVNAPPDCQHTGDYENIKKNIHDQ